MPDPWVPERGRLFLRELTAQLAMSASPNCNDVADAIDMDEHESGEVMHWLARESLVREIGPIEMSLFLPSAATRTRWDR